MNTKVRGEAIKEGSIPLSALKEELYAYPVDTLDGKENKVIGLGSDAVYAYVGELVASEFGTPTEEQAIGDAVETAYVYQPIYDGKYFECFEEYFQDKYITLYIGNDVDGYTSNKVYKSEDANNLVYYPFSFIGAFGPTSLEVAISPNNILYCRNYWHYANKNSKVFLALRKQQLDINLIPQEIARKEDIIKEVDNYEYPTVTIDADTMTYSGQLGSKYINVDANIASPQYSNKVNKKFYLADKSNGFHRYENDCAVIIFSKNNTIEDFFLANPILTSDTYDIEYWDYKNCNISTGNCRLNNGITSYPATIDSDDFVTALINGKCLKYKLNRETHLLELQQEIDLSKENAGGGADWNAQEGEAGYIENRTHYLYGKSQSALGKGVNKIDYTNSLFALFDGIVQVLPPFEDGLEIWINYGPPVYIKYTKGDYGENFIELIDITNFCAYKTIEFYSGIKKIDEKFIPDTVLKTTPQELLYTEKNQVLINLGVNSLVVVVGNTNVEELERFKYLVNNREPNYTYNIIHFRDVTIIGEIVHTYSNRCQIKGIVIQANSDSGIKEGDSIEIGGTSGQVLDPLLELDVNLSTSGITYEITSQSIDPVVWKYICDPFILQSGRIVPDELIIQTNEGYDFKYKYPSMFRSVPGWATKSGKLVFDYANCDRGELLPVQYYDEYSAIKGCGNEWYGDETVLIDDDRNDGITNTSDYTTGLWAINKDKRCYLTV